MGERLTRNICSLDDHANLSDVNDLSARRKDNIGEELEYACQFWTKHLANSPSSGPDVEEVQRAIEKFFTTHLLFWIEVLIIMENLDASVYSINDIRQWYILVSCGYVFCYNIYSPLLQGDSVCKWADDSQNFILEHFDTICNSPSQIYHFALPFFPSSSQLQKHYSAEFLHEVKVVKGTKAKWETCFRTVLLGSCTQTLSYWNNIIAVGSRGGDIIILGTVTGSQMAVLSGHTQEVNCLTFSSDGRSLVSGSCDKTVKLWDIQTGGVIMTFYGHVDLVWSVSISADCTRVASGSDDNSIRLWDIQTRECYQIIEQQNTPYYVTFSPIDSQCLISISVDKVWQWDINGHQIPPTYNGSHIAFSPDYTQFALCNGKVITVQNSNSREVMAEFHVASKKTKCCCFSPDGKLLAAAAGNAAYIWNITSLDPDPIKTLIGHSDEITSLVFSSSSSLISASYDESIKFWKICVLLGDPAATDLESTPPTLPSIRSVSLQAKAGIAISSDADGVVKTWDILTGHCKATFQTPTPDSSMRDAKLIDGKLISVWHKDDKIHIWDVEEGNSLQILYSQECSGLKISGDGSKILCLSYKNIQAWSMWTWESVGKVELVLEGVLYLDPLCTDSSRVWICSSHSSAQVGWEFGDPGSSPIQFDPSTERPHLDFIGGHLLQSTSVFWIKDTATGREVFQLRGRYAKPNDVQWDGQYLVAGYESGEVLILDFHHVLSRYI